MTPEQIEEHIVETKVLLSKIDTKLATLCARTKNTEDKMDNLPCEAHTQLMMSEVSGRVPWRVFMWIVGVLIAVSVAGFSYTNNVSEHIHAHETNMRHLSEPLAMGD